MSTRQRAAPVRQPAQDRVRLEILERAGGAPVRLGSRSSRPRHRRQAGRRGDDEITLFDSTGLAIQDLALVVELMHLHEAGSLNADKVSL